MKTFENFNKDWNDVLHLATWTHKKSGKRYYIDFENLKKAIENGADVDSCESLNWGVRNNNYEVVKYLLEHEADPNHRTNNNDWSIISSSLLDIHTLFSKSEITETDIDTSIKICKLLIDYDADLSQKNFQYNTALMLIFPYKNFSKRRIFPPENDKEETYRNIIAQYFVEYVFEHKQLNKYDEYLEFFEPFINNIEKEEIIKYKKQNEFNL